MAKSHISVHVKKENLAAYGAILQYCKEDSSITESDIFNSIIPHLQKGLTKTRTGAIFLNIQKGIIPIK